MNGLTYTWMPGDTALFVAARFLAQSGYDDTPTLQEAMRANNPLIIDWIALAPGTRVFIPYRP